MNTDIRMGATVVGPTTGVVILKEEILGFLNQILRRLCALTDEEAIKEGRAKGSSSFRLAMLRQIA